MTECNHQYVRDHQFILGDSDPMYVFLCSACNHKLISLTRNLREGKENE